jgi:exodeoxyribonuclease V beta subunit
MAIEASAGTGKTYTLASLATRYIAEGGVPPSELLIVTFTRAATGELRARVRERMVEAVAFLERADRVPSEDDVLLDHLASGNVPLLLERLRRAITEFDAATITTIHGFATQVRQTLGAAAGIDPDARLVDDSKELVDEVCADVLASASLGLVGTEPLPSMATLCALTRVAAGQSDLRLEPRPDDQGARPEQVLVTRLVEESLQKLDERRRSRGSVSFDDVLVQLRDVLQGPGGAAVVEALRNRFTVTLIDEFQDTDRVQWDIFSTLFGGEGSGTTLVLVGDPKQAIYRFRGADIGAYLGAVDRAGTERRSLVTNWRSDGAVLTALAALLEQATFGDASIDFVPVGPAPTNQHRRLRTSTGEDLPALVVRVATGDGLERNKNPAQVATVPAGRAIDRDLAMYVRDLLDTAVLPAAKEGTEPRRVRPSDVAVLVRTGGQGDAVQAALRREGIPAVVATSGNVLESPAAVQLRYLLHAMGRPSDARTVRTFALSWFVGWSADVVAAASDDALASLQEQLADWAALLAARAVAEVLARVWADTGVVARVLGAPDGDRNLTDLDQLAELLHAAVPRGTAGVSGLMAVLEAEPEGDDDAEVDGDVAARRIESEADAVQIMTVWKAKGLEFPVVCVPTLWRPGKNTRDALVYTDPDSGERACDLTNGGEWPDKQAARQRKKRTEAEEAGERLRLVYVALTRAKHQTVVWWANAHTSRSTALAHVLFARSEGAIDPEAFAQPSVTVPTDADIEDALAPLVERAQHTIRVVPIDDRPESPVRWRDPDEKHDPPSLELARFETVLDRSVHRWSFSSMTQQAPTGRFDPYDPSLADGGAHDEQEDRTDLRSGPGLGPEPVPAPAAGEGGSRSGDAPPPGPLAPLPAGAAFGTMVHSVLEQVDFASVTLEAEVGAALDDELSWRGLDLTPTDATPGTGADGARLVVEGLRAAIETPLGALFAGRRLADLAQRDRLNELSFDMRLGQAGHPARVEDIGRLVASHLERSDPLGPWAAALAGGVIDVELAGYLTGSIDLVARVRDGDGGLRFVVADYKTNQLTRRGAVPHPDDYGSERLTEAMVEHHYPLQAVLYAVALHRYLRWRQPGYRPETHLGGASYLFVRGMTGPGVATTDGCPHGVFDWAMAPAMVEELSELLDGRRPVTA